MLICLSSFLPRVSSAIKDLLVKKGTKHINYSPSIMEEIMESKEWKYDIVIELPTPLDWAQFKKRPFTVLAVIYPSFTTKDKLEEQLDSYNQYNRDLIEIRQDSINNTNYIEIYEEEGINKLLTHQTRPEWTAYFMSIAQIAATRANCMKRKVGAVLVKNNRVVGIGYNGTSTGMKNCCDGGCARCNDNARQGTKLSDCFCIHAEESAFLEASAAECHQAQLYTTVYPCRLCSRKIVQMKISHIYYIEDYGDDQEIRNMFIENNIELVRITNK
ncbi:dCMP deaminase [Nematocida sp. AWRm80]|nr:dCMP deaminase [Nematocida sp. AWRm80]